MASTDVPAVPLDTSLEAAHVQWRILRQMPAKKRLEIALSMGDSLRRLVAAGVRSRHPNYSEEQVRHAVIRLSLGEELFRKVYPDCDVQV
jgi:hypothetical protein